MKRVNVKKNSILFSSKQKILFMYRKQIKQIILLLHSCKSLIIIHKYDENGKEKNIYFRHFHNVEFFE